MAGNGYTGCQSFRHLEGCREGHWQLGHGSDGEIEAAIVREECGELGRSVPSEGEPSMSSPAQWGGGRDVEIHAWPASKCWWWASVWSMLDTFGPPIPQAALTCGSKTSPLSFFQFEEFFSFSFFTFSLQSWLTLRPWACSLARGQMYSRHMGGRGSTALPALSKNSHGSRESSHFPSRFSPSPSQPGPLLRTSWGHAS